MTRAVRRPPSALRPRAILALLTLVGSSLACSGLFPPPTVTVTPSADPCGGWTADVEVKGGDGRRVRVLADGVTVYDQAVDGDLKTTISGHAAPATHVTFQPDVDEVDPLPPVDLLLPASTVSLTLQYADDGARTGGFYTAGQAPRIVGQIDGGSCDVRTLTYVVRADGGGPAARAPIPPMGTLAIDLPPRPVGDYGVRVDVDGPWGPATSASVPIHVVGSLDADHDGFEVGLGGDCDDTNRRINPDASEGTRGNHVDDDCDGTVDEGTELYDDDGDGKSEVEGDCDDTDPDRFSGAPELGDCRDNDCDGQVDEGVTLAGGDDAYEPDDTHDRAYDVGGKGEISFSTDLKIVSRDLHDDEWFTFWSDDGPFDNWYVSADLVTIGEGAEYEVEILYGATRTGSSHVSHDHEGAVDNGASFLDDSGQYWVHVKPVTLPKNGCPAHLRINSG